MTSQAPLLAAGLVLTLAASAPDPGRSFDPASISTPEMNPAARLVVESAKRQTRLTTVYDPSYVQIEYPGGDIPIERGVCSDVIVRAFRHAGIDLQREVHVDMKRSFASYPRHWGLSRPDPNIDHRRVPNLMRFFERRGKSIRIAASAATYRPGDVVAWDLGRGITHIGIVSDVASTNMTRYQVVHNIGQGARLEDVLFDWKIIGHYRYL